MKRLSRWVEKVQMRRWLLLAGVLLVVTGPAPGQLQPPSVQAGDQVDGVAITVTRFGPYPASVQHTTDSFMLIVVNRSGVLDDTFSLVLKPADSGASTPVPSLLDLHSTHSKQRDHRLINPLPGSYQLVFQSHPEWVVNIIITPN